LGIHLRRIEVIADDEDEIIEAARRMSKNYDLVVTSGGIGPTYVSSPDICAARCTRLTGDVHTGTTI
jgi:molybdopterin-biosynthesis enzyme MoeA-like protein